MRTAVDHRPVLATAALVFTASAAVAARWCGSMSAMPGMEMPGGWTMSMAFMRMPGQGWPGAAATFLGMWSVMMLAMMLPALGPVLLREHRCGRRGFALAGAYFGAWLMLGAVLFPAGALLADQAMRHADVSRLAPLAAGIVLIVAGALQSGAWKSRALADCRDAGCCTSVRDANGWWRGFALGLRCIRCCAPWTAVLLVAGVMDLAAMALVTVAISLERLLPRGERIVRIAGSAMLASGVLVLSNY